MKRLIPKDIAQTDIENAFHELTGEGFLDSKDTDTFAIHHASITDSWKNSSAREIVNSNIIALQRYEQYYMNLLINKVVTVSEQEIADIPWLALLEDVYKRQHETLLHNHPGNPVGSNRGRTVLLPPK